MSGFAHAMDCLTHATGLTPIHPTCCHVLHLQDDPLSAVDPRVGRTLFERCIGPAGVMCGTTRLLVRRGAWLVGPSWF